MNSEHHAREQVEHQAHGVRPHALKRVFDLVVVLLAAPLWLPVVGAVAAVVAVALGRPVFFRQPRAGRDGKPFRIVKFRTMTDARDDAGVLLPDAQRLTRFGAMLRSTSLDELPELFNVLAGDMSLVGPRPLLLEYLSRYSATHRLRHAVSPGVTGLAQVSGRNALTWSDRFDLDVQYARSNSLALDVRILARTLRTVFARDGISHAGEATMTAFTGYENDPAHRG